MMPFFSADNSVSHHQVTIQETGEHFVCTEEQHLLQGMLSLGKKGIPSGCHGGGCGVCKIRIMSGTDSYRNLSMSRAHISASDEAQGIVLACRTYPLKDIELRVLGHLRKQVVRLSNGFITGDKAIDK